MRVTIRIPLRWIVLLALAFAGAIVAGAWHWPLAIEFSLVLLALYAAAKVAVAAASAAQGEAQIHRVRIIAVPPGEAPQWVREKWVGLELPLAQSSTEASPRAVFGVLSGPRTSLARSGRLLGSDVQEHTGYAVNVLEAVAILERTSPEAAQWWRANTRHLMQPTRCFLFPDYVCGVVQER